MSVKRGNHNRNILDGTAFHGVYVLSIDIKSQWDRDSPFVRRGIKRLGESSRHLKDVNKRYGTERGRR